MTIIQNQKNNNEYKFLMPAMIGFLTVFSFMAILLYNQTVNISHEIASAKSDLQSLEIKNAELKNAVSDMTSQEKINKLASSRGLVVEKNPQYLQGEQLVKGN